MTGRHIQKTVYKVSDLLSWQRGGSLLLSPAFQRRSVWPKGAKSLLIDTVVRGIPMPIVFLREVPQLRNLEVQRQVVDGQQRLRTLFAFIDPASLKDFNRTADAYTVSRTHNPNIAGKQFLDLPEEIRREILGYEFSVHVLPVGTEDSEVLRIFARMNSTGYKLNAQELRNAQYYGEFKTSSYALAYEQLPRWKSWNVFGDSEIARMLEVEEVSDSMLTIMDGLHAKRQSSIDAAYRKYDDTFDKRDEVERRFREVMDNIDDAIGTSMHSLAFRKRALFNTLFAHAYDLIFGLGSPLNRKKASKLTNSFSKRVSDASKLISAEDLPEEVLRVVRGATTDLSTRKARLKFLENPTRRGQSTE